MLLPHENIDYTELTASIKRQYEVTDARLVFVPLGEDSWSYRLGPLWVSVRRDGQGHEPAAYRLAHELHATGWDAVLAPLAGRDGRIIREVSNHPVIVFPYLDVEQVGGGAASDAREITEIIQLIERLHRTRAQADVPHETFQLPFAEELHTSVAAAATSHLTVGPYSSSLHSLICRNRTLIDEMRAEIDEVAVVCRADREAFGLTHGEPSAANILRHRGRLLLADWGAARWGPPERDWFHVARTLGVKTPMRPAFRRFYELRWRLGEISEYVARFTAPHVGDSDDVAMWSRLLRYLPVSAAPVR